MYESVIDLVVGQATMLFVELHYTLATEEAERIGVDHVARMSSNEAGESSLGEYWLMLSLIYWFAVLNQFSKEQSSVNTLSGRYLKKIDTETLCSFSLYGLLVSSPLQDGNAAIQHVSFQACVDNYTEL